MKTQRSPASVFANGTADGLQPLLSEGVEVSQLWQLATRGGLVITRPHRLLHRLEGGHRCWGLNRCGLHRGGNRRFTFQPVDVVQQHLQGLLDFVQAIPMARGQHLHRFESGELRLHGLADAGGEVGADP